eukprot:1354087-Pleurochrysis_carterae.AAC.1
MAAGRPKPMVPSEPEVMIERGVVQRRNCAQQPGQNYSGAANTPVTTYKRKGSARENAPRRARLRLAAAAPDGQILVFLPELPVHLSESECNSARVQPECAH